MKSKQGDCYIDIWKEADFRGETLRLYGPAEYSQLSFAQGNWGDEIGSLRVGPCAMVLAYRDRDFQDEQLTFGPNDEVADLRGLKFDDDIDSVKVIDSLKIFDHLLDRKDPPPEEPAAPKQDASPKPKRNEHKGRRRGGK